MKIKVLSTLAVLAIVALPLVACQQPATTLDEPVQVEVVNAGDFVGPAGATERGSLLCSTEDGNCVESWNGSDIVVYSDAGSTQKFLLDGATGDLTIAGGLSVTGGVTGTNVLTTGNQTIAGIKTFTTPAALTGGVTGPLVVTGPTAAATATPALRFNNTGAGNVSLQIERNATPVASFSNAGGLTAASLTTTGALSAGTVSAKVPVLVKDADYTVTTADAGSLIKASGAITLTLPAAAAGLHYCIVNFTGDDQVIAFADAADVALNEVNSPGDRVTNTTAYDNICLAAIDAVNWVTLSSVGTWADGN